MVIIKIAKFFFLVNIKLQETIYLFIIDFTKKLIHTICLPNFYRGLKCLVVPMLANMMESDKKKRWTFDSFFGEVFKIKDMLPVRLYDCSVGSNLKVYVEKNDR